MYEPGMDDDDSIANPIAEILNGRDDCLPHGIPGSLCLILQMLPLMHEPANNVSPQSNKKVTRLGEPLDDAVHDIGDDGAANELLPQPFQEAYDRIYKPLDLIVYPGGSTENSGHQRVEDA